MASKPTRRIKESRHRHPHVDPRQPRHGAKPDTNPPVFAWKPGKQHKRFHLLVARDDAFRDIVLDVHDLADPVYLPEKALPQGRYSWKWGVKGAASETFVFEITADAAVVEVPPVGEWFSRLPQGHPRVYIRPEQVEALQASRAGRRAQAWEELRTIADRRLAEPHEIAEPPFLPGWQKDYEGTFAVWYKILWESRGFVQGAEALALAYLASGDAKYGRAACRRMASLSEWDPQGSSHIAHNDEAHMSFMWHGPPACDWVWDLFTDDERARVIDQFRRRGQITFEHVRHKGCYGIERFDSHSGREIVFLALLAIVFHEHIPEARTWLEWLRPVLCGVWPIWAGWDGSWAEGISYGLAYVGIMTMFATALKQGVGVDLYRRPFWRNHAAWRLWCHPPYAEWIGFGDHSERWGGTLKSTADLVDLIGRQTDAGEFSDYVAAMRNESATCPTPKERGGTDLTVGSQLYFLDAGQIAKESAHRHGMLRVFPGAGWAALRTDLEDPSRDIAMIFRSSPYGSVSHAHANNNDFILHVAGRVLAMPSGYYDGYGSAHHVNWVQQTKSHNCLTLSDAGQLVQSRESTGAIEAAYEDERIAYLRGNADACYLPARRCRRHVLFLKPHSCFVLIDEFLAAPGVNSSLQWNIHSWERFEVDEAARSFRLQRGDSTLAGHLMCRRSGFFSQSEGWDPPPMKQRDQSLWFPQHHLRFTANPPWRYNLAVVLCPGHAGLQPARVLTESADSLEIARIGPDLVLINEGEAIRYEGIESKAVAVVRVGGVQYEIDEDGIRQEE